METVALNYREYGAGRPLVILHGLFGSLDNWAAIAKELGEHRHVYAVDQRNHGHSPHTDTHTYNGMVEDLHRFFLDHGITEADVIGHSMGGKTAMRFAAAHPEMVGRLIVADMGVKAYPVHHDLIIRSMQAIDLPNVASRSEAEQELSRFIEERDVVLFLTKNIYRGKNAAGEPCYAWRFNLDVLAMDIGEMGLPVPHGSGVPALFIRGTRSRYILPEDEAGIRELFPKSEFMEMDAGHWLHAQDAESFLKAVRGFLD
jgi:esterase